MKLILLIFICFLSSCNSGDKYLISEMQKRPFPSEIAFKITYISDDAQFKEASDPTLSSDQKRALKFAQDILKLFLKGAQVQANYAIAEAEWGYQINYDAVKVFESDKWVDVDEGFGEIFLSPGLSRIQIDFGP